MPSELPVAIIGGGPGGLLLANMLHLRGVPFIVFERDESLFARPQGGTLDIHAETGQAALRRAGLFDAFLTHARYEDQGMRLLDKSGGLVFEKADSNSGDRPEIDRGQLRQLLLDRLPGSAVQWGRALDTVSVQDGGALALRFRDGSTAAASHVVGADGAWSRVRPLLSAARPEYTGTTMFELAIDDIDRRHPELAALIGRGMLVAKGDGKTIFAQRNAGAHVRVYLSLKRPAGAEASGVLPETRASLIAELGGWDERLVRLIEVAGDAVRTWPLHVLPVGHRWEHRPGITLLGDAAHLMPPAGEGANLALADAADLGDALSAPGDVGEAVARYEHAMTERGRIAARQAMDMLGRGSDDDGLAAIEATVRGEARGPQKL